MAVVFVAAVVVAVAKAVDNFQLAVADDFVIDFIVVAVVVVIVVVFVIVVVANAVKNLRLLV